MDMVINDFSWGLFFWQIFVFFTFVFIGYFVFRLFKRLK